MDFEIRADGSLHIEGYVNAVERDSRAVVCPECGKCVEQIAAGAFGEALRAAPDVAMLVNHDKGRKIGSTAEGNLSLCEDNIGLRAVAEITDSEVIEKARRGLLRGWSFGFKARDTDIERRAGNLPRRRVKALDIFEVSIIDDRFSPCYAGTSIEMRAGNEELMEMRSENIVGNVSGFSEYIARYNRTVLNGYRLRAKMPGFLPWGEEQRGNGENYIQRDNGQLDGSRPSGDKSSGSSEKGVDKSDKENKNIFGSDLTNEEKRSILKEKIAKGELSLKVRQQKQNAHIKGTPQYKEGNSYLSVDMNEIQQIVDKKHLTGTVFITDSGKHFRERIHCDKIIGVNIDKEKGAEEITSNATIHYSKNGAHIVPRHGSDKKI